jgi:predicted amino acid racemase
MPKTKRKIIKRERDGTVARGRIRAELEIMKLRKEGCTNTQHVLPGRTEGWDVKKGESHRTTKHFDVKKEAVQYARRLCRNQGAQLIIHYQDGRPQIRSNGSVG